MYDAYSKEKRKKTSSDCRTLLFLFAFVLPPRHREAVFLGNAPPPHPCGNTLLQISKDWLRQQTWDSDASSTKFLFTIWLEHICNFGLEAFASWARRGQTGLFGRLFSLGKTFANPLAKAAHSDPAPLLEIIGALY